MRIRAWVALLGVIAVVGGFTLTGGPAWAAPYVSGQAACSGSRYQVTWTVPNTTTDEAALDQMSIEGQRVTFHRDPAGPALTMTNLILVYPGTAVYFIAQVDTYQADLKISFRIGWVGPTYQKNRVNQQDVTTLPSRCGSGSTPSTAPATGTSPARPSASPSTTTGRTTAAETRCDGKPDTCATPSDVATPPCATADCGTPAPDAAVERALDRSGGTSRPVRSAALMAIVVGALTFSSLLGWYLWRRRQRRPAAADA